MCTKNRPAGLGSNRKYPSLSVTARNLSSAPSTVTITPSSGRFTKPPPAATGSDANTRPATAVPGTAAGGGVEYAFDLKLDEAAIGGVVFVEIFAEAEGVGIVGGSGLLGPLWPWEWTTYTGSFTAPPATNFLTIQFTATTGATAGSTCVLHVDNVSLAQPGVIPAETTTWSELNALFR